jgi:hypothetical protein
MAIADLTVTSQRNADIDFTMPFMKLGKYCKCIFLEIDLFIQFTTDKLNRDSLRFGYNRARLAIF